MIKYKLFYLKTALFACFFAYSVMMTGCTNPQKKEEVQKIKDADFHYKLGMGYFENHQVTLAIRDLTISLEKNPDHLNAHYLMGYILMGRRNYPKAIYHFKESLRIDPKFFNSINSLAATYLAMKRWKDAEEVLLKLLDEPLYTSPELVHNNLGWAYHNMRKYPQALEHYRMAIFLKPQFCLSYNNSGVTMVATNNPTGAVNQFKKALAQCPNDYAEPHFHLGKLYEQARNYALAKRHFRRCYNLNPQNNLGQRCQQYLQSLGR